jgi:hypothetical protein
MTFVPFLALLALLALTVLMVWAGATLYFRRRDQLFWAYAKELAEEGLQTGAELAAYEQFDKDFPPLSEEQMEWLNGFRDPAEAEGADVPEMEGDPVAEVSPSVSAEIPDGQVFEEDGRRYKFVKNPVTGRRVKLDVTGQVRNANALPMPNLEVATAIQAITQAEGLFTGISENPDSLSVNVFALLENARTQEAYVLVKAQVIAGLKELEHKYKLAQQPAWVKPSFTDEDEAFYQEAQAQAARGPIALHIDQPLKDARVDVKVADEVPNRVEKKAKKKSAVKAKPRKKIKK